MTATSEAYTPPNGDAPAVRAGVGVSLPSGESLPSDTTSVSALLNQRLSLLPEATVPELSAISTTQVETPQFSDPNRAYRWNRNNYSKRRRKIDIWSFFLTFLMVPGSMARSGAILVAILRQNKRRGGGDKQFGFGIRFWN